MSGQHAWVHPGACRRVAALVSASGARRILLVTGRESFGACGAERALLPQLGSAEVVRFSEFRANPSLDDLARGVALARDFRSQLSIAVGGGSVLDMGKAINALFVQAADCRATVIQRLPLGRRPPPLIALPTTAGTGSEATHSATLYEGDAKHSLAHAFLVPAYALVDSALSYGMPPRLAAVTAMDALSHAIESYWAVNATAASRRLSSRALACLLPAVRASVLRASPEARDAMALGAHLAGRAIDIAKTTAAHALSYTLTTRHGVAHGHAVALSLGRLLSLHGEWIGRIGDPDRRRQLRRTLGRLCHHLGQATPEAAGRMFYRLMEDLGLETSLTQLGITGALELEALATAVNAERLSNHPVPLGRDDLLHLLAG
jgi:alcohol dehydrogenase class IV